MSASTNVKPIQLSYTAHSSSKYDKDIANSIPFHSKMHNLIRKFLEKNFDSTKDYCILDLGVGTGITSKAMKDILANCSLDVVDFSKKMLNGAKKKLGTKKVNYIFGDYAKLAFQKKYDFVVSVIGIHHQTNAGKKRLFKKIFSILKPGAYFIFGDLVTFKEAKKAALNNALHYNYLVENATDQQTLADWAHHHLFLNKPAPIEEQKSWLKEAGFKVKLAFLKMNTALLFCKKPK